MADANSQDTPVAHPAGSAPQAGASGPGRTIDFHVNVDNAVNYACRVVRKARSAGKTVLVFSRDAQRRARLDLALWTFSALDFLPHVTLPSPRAAQTPIWISGEPPQEPRDLLLLLDDDPAPDFTHWFARFDRIIDVVSAAEEDRARGRSRFKAYRNAGLFPVAHEVGAP